MEYWDIYDSNRNKTGRHMVRGEGMAPGEFHLVIHICIFNREGKMLIQQRQPFKEGYSNLWDVTVVGSAVEGDDSRMAAERELFEELGLKLDLEGIRPHMTVNFQRGFDDIYLLEREVDLSGLRLQPEEVQAVRWATEEEILQMIGEGTFIPYYPELIKTFFAMRGSLGGSHRP